MLKNYFIIAYRNIVKNKFYSFLNIFGLSIGIVSTTLILLFIQNEISFDKYHEKYSRVYRLESNFTIKGKHDLFAVTSLPLAKVIKTDYPEVENYARFAQVGKVLLKLEDVKFFEDSIYYADSTVFNIFTHKFLQGSPKTALNSPYSLVLTQSLAHKFFGKQNPIGKTLATGRNKLYKVTGVIEDLPVNSHMRFNGLMSMNTLAEIIGDQRYNSTESLAFWNVNFYSYILMKPNTNIKTILDKSPQFYKKYMAKVGDQIGGGFSLMATRLDKLHFSTGKAQGDLNTGNIAYIYIFSIIAVFILLIASINYMNMATARSTKRAKEVGLRKLVGAEKNKLITQFLSESVIIAFISLIFALILIRLLLPLFNDLTSKNLTFGFISNPGVFLSIIGITFIVGLISGSYPAVFLSSFLPVSVLKGKGSSSTSSGALRKTLVIVQFVLTSVMIVGTIVVSGQLKFMRNMELGFDKSNIVFLEEQDSIVIAKSKEYREELLKIASVESVATSTSIPGSGYSKQVMRVEKNGEMTEEVLNNFYIDHDFLDLMKIKLVKGRNFNKDLPTDFNGSFLINETAAKKLGWGDSAIGKRIHYGFDLKGNIRKNGKVIGVMKDYHYNSLHNPIEPLMLLIDSARFNNFISIRINPANSQKTINEIKAKREEFNPKLPFSYRFLDEQIDDFYKDEQRIALLFRYFTILTIIIAGLGMLGLSAFMTEQRTKEIGVRKVLGAEITSIVFMFSKQFAKWVIIANLVAWGIAYFAMNKWLQDFVFKWIHTFGQSASVWIMIFVSTLVITVIFALLTVAWQVIKAAIANPVESLKYE